MYLLLLLPKWSDGSFLLHLVYLLFAGQLSIAIFLSTINTTIISNIATSLPRAYLCRAKLCCNKDALLSAVHNTCTVRRSARFRSPPTSHLQRFQGSYPNCVDHPYSVHPSHNSPTSLFPPCFACNSSRLVLLMFQNSPRSFDFRIPFSSSKFFSLPSKLRPPQSHSTLDIDSAATNILSRPFERHLPPGLRHL